MDSDNDGEGADGDNGNEVVDGGNTQEPRKRPKITRWLLSLLSKNVHLLTRYSSLDSFIRKYEEMDESSMWKLSTGKVVEKCIYEGVIGSSCAEGLARMWVISSKDPWMRNLFTDEEWREMQSSRIVQKVTGSSQSCWDLLLKFKRVNPTVLRVLLLFLSA